MRKFNLFVLGMALVLFVVSFALATNDVQVTTKDCFQLPTASTKICKVIIRILNVAEWITNGNTNNDWYIQTLSLITQRVLIFFTF